MAFGRMGDIEPMVVGGRLLFTVGAVALFDFLLADPGKYKAFRERQGEAARKAKAVHEIAAKSGGDSDALRDSALSVRIKRKLQIHRLQEVELPDGRLVFAPWEFRNSIMGGRHTEDMGGNLSFQELMFMPLTARDYIEAQRVTNALQSRVIQIIQDSEGLNFVGIGLEGGVVASYARRVGDLLPEERALKVAVQAIEECGFVPDRDVCLALDPAASELSLAYREETGEKESIGQYLFWRAEDPRVMTTDELVDLYKRWIREYPIVSLEDAFAEDDPEGWKHLMAELDDEILIIGDDLVTTKDTSIIHAAEEGLINTALIKANQIGTLSETLLATRAAKEHGLALVVSHRSKSPNEVMEADIAFAVGALGLKCGGGSNTERLIKYGRIVELIHMAKKGVRSSRGLAWRPHHQRHQRPRGADQRGHSDRRGGRPARQRHRSSRRRRPSGPRREPTRPSTWSTASSRPAPSRGSTRPLPVQRGREDLPLPGRAPRRSRYRRRTTTSWRGCG